MDISKSIAAVAMIFAQAACAPETVGKAAPLPPEVDRPEIRAEPYVGGLETPWSLAFTPDGRLLIAERPGRIRVVRNGKLDPRPLAVLSEVVETSEGGLLGMCLHPDFKRTGWLYVAYTYENPRLTVKVVRYRETANGLAEPKTIVDRIEGGANHDGCRIKFGPDGKLYVTTGERYRKELAQDMSSLNGKTLRLNDDGTVPKDNPFVGRPGVRPEIWSYGHRNAQGIDWQPGTGLQFQTEHGPSGSDAPGGGDEVNIVEKGKDYGWPKVHHRQTMPGTVPPLLEYTPAVAPCGGAFYTGDKVPQFKDDFFFANLRGECLIRVELDGRRVVNQERLFSGRLGRLRDVVSGPDGYLYFCSSNRDGRGSPRSGDDRVYRLVPAR